MFEVAIQETLLTAEHTNPPKLSSGTAMYLLSPYEDTEKEWYTMTNNVVSRGVDVAKHTIFLVDIQFILYICC